MKNKINIGIIGKNFGYNVIYKSFLKNKKYKIRAFSFKSKKNNKINIPKEIKIYSDWKKLILDKEIHAVVIATPPFLHKKIIKFAIKNKKHIFCEKPFTCSYQDANFISNLIKREKKIFKIVNYEFSEIEAFNFFKKKIINKIKINHIYLNWFINFNKKVKRGWKENHSKGGGIFFNYICHAIYYLEFLFGEMSAVKTDIFIEKKEKIKNFVGIIFFSNGLFVRINIKVGLLKDKIKPTHELEIFTDRKNYILKTKLNSLSDKFNLITFDNKNKNYKKVLFKRKKNNDDFRIYPTFKNSKKFSDSILKNKFYKPNFFDATRIHHIINKMLISSKRKKLININ